MITELGAAQGPFCNHPDYMKGSICTYIWYKVWCNPIMVTTWNRLPFLGFYSTRYGILNTGGTCPPIHYLFIIYLSTYLGT